MEILYSTYLAEPNLYSNKVKPEILCHKYKIAPNTFFFTICKCPVSSLSNNKTDVCKSKTTEIQLTQLVYEIQNIFFPHA